MALNLAGCNAGFVILVGDDPGAWGSQNEQDSRFFSQQFSDLFDQSILYLHLGLESAEIDETRKKLRAYGIRTATDLEAAFQAAESRGENELRKFLMILDDPNAQPEPLSRVQIILDTLQDDDWMTYLRNWRELSQRSTQAFTLKGISMVPLEDHVQRAISMAL